MNATERRLTEMEMALAHAEAKLEALDEVVCAQADRLDRLERLSHEMARRLAEPGDGPDPEADVRPPHW